MPHHICRRNQSRIEFGFKIKRSRTSDKCRKIIMSKTVKLKMAKKGKSQKVAPKEQSDADADQAAGEAGGKKGKKVTKLREIW